MTDPVVLPNPEAFLGLVDSPPDPRDWPLAGAIADQPAPTARSFRAPLVLPNANQFAQDATHSACVAYSGCNTRILTEHAVDGLDLLFAQLELYRRCKEIDGMPDQPGTSIRFALDVLTKRGAAVGLVPAGRAGGLADPVSPAQYQPISGYVRVDETVLTEIKKAVWYLWHSWAAIRWYTNWNGSAGLVTPTHPVLPKPGTYSTGHGICIYGWDDDYPTWAGVGALRFKNSFGRGWGDDGDGLIPYQLLPTIIREAWATFDVPDAPPPAPTPPAGGDMKLFNVRTDQVGDVAVGTPVFELDGTTKVRDIAIAWTARSVLADTGETPPAFYALRGPAGKLVLVAAANVTGIRPDPAAADLTAALARLAAKDAAFDAVAADAVAGRAK